MKDYPKDWLEDGRPDITPAKAINFCLDRLYEDDEHTLDDTVVEGLIFEEVIGALLLAKDSLE